MPALPNPQPNQREVIARNKNLMRKLNQAFSVGDTSAIDEFISPEIVFHSPHVVQMQGRPIEGLKEEMKLPFESFAEQNFREGTIVAEGDMVFLEWELTGIHRGPVHGAPASGRRFMLQGGEVVRIRDGLVVEHWDHFTKPRLESLIQFGVLDQKLLNQLKQLGLV